MDGYLYKETLIDSKDDIIAVDKQDLYVLDQNSGVYNSIVTFDTSSLSNSGLYLAYSEAYLEIPFVVSFRSSIDITAQMQAANAKVAAYVAGLKNGYHNLIDSIQVDYQNTNVVQQMSFTNFFVNYKLMSTMSPSDVAKWGSTIGFAPDSAGSCTYAAAASANGLGFANNRDNTTAIGLTVATRYDSPDFANAGFAQRKRQNTGFSIETEGGASAGYGGIPAANVLQVAKNYFDSDAGAGAARIYFHVIIATIRLKDLSDFFAQIPLVKGGFMRIVLTYNSTQHALTAVAAGPTMTIAAGGTTIRSGRTCPYMISSALASNSANGVVTVGDQTITIDSGIVRTTQISPSVPLNSCRLYVPGYTLNPIKEAQLLQSKPVRDVFYNDIYTYSFTNIANNGTFNQLITNGIANIKYLVLIPVANISSVGALAPLVSDAQSPFSTVPATTAPMAALTNFNVLVGGRNVFQQNELYDFEAFIQQLSSINAINGGASTGLTSGLLTSYMFDNAYRYYVADLSRMSPIEEGVPKSIQVQGTNVSGYPLDFICVVVFGRKISIDMATGGLVR